MKRSALAGLNRIKGNSAVAAACRFTVPARVNPFPLQVLLTVLYRLLLDAAYVLLLSPAYSRAGFTTTLLWHRYMTSLLAVVIFAPVVAHVLNDRSPSSILLSFINYIYFIPLTSYFGCHGTTTSFFAVSLAYWSLFLLLQIRIPKITLKPLGSRHIHAGVLVLTGLSVLFVFAISGIYTGFRFTLDFINVYEIRAEAAGYAMPAIASYLLGAMPMVLAILLVYWMQRKKAWIVLLLVLTYLFYFSISASKSAFFFLFLVVAGILFYRDWMLRWMPGLLVPAVGVLFAEYAMNGIWLLSLFVRRMMYVPVQLSEKYASFFSEHPLNLFQEGVMGKLSFDALYSARIPKVIGEYMGEYWTSSNNGLIGDMYANLPVVLGLLTMPLILVICFRFFDFTAANVDRKVVVPFCIYHANAFINSSWSIVLLSHGFLISCLLLYFFSKEGSRHDLH